MILVKRIVLWIILIITFNSHSLYSKNNSLLELVTSMSNIRCAIVIPTMLINSSKMINQKSLEEYIAIGGKELYFMCKPDLLKFAIQNHIEYKKIDLVFRQMNSEMAQLDQKEIYKKLHQKYLKLLKELQENKASIFYEDKLLYLIPINNHLLKQTNRHSAMYGVYYERSKIYKKAENLNNQIFNIWKNYIKNNRNVNTDSYNLKKHGDDIFYFLSSTNDLCTRLNRKYTQLEKIINNNWKISFSNIDTYLNYIGIEDTYLKECGTLELKNYKRFKRDVITFANINSSKIEKNLFNTFLLDNRNSYYLNGRATYGLLTYYYELKTIHQYVNKHSMLSEKLYNLSKEIYNFYIKYVMERY